MIYSPDLPKGEASYLSFEYYLKCLVYSLWELNDEAKSPGILINYDILGCLVSIPKVYDSLSVILF